MFNRSNIINKRFKGNVLAMVLIVGGIAGVTTVSMAALALKDSQINSKMEDSQNAYQAASAGIKLGLLYKSYRPNIELSSECQDNTNSSTCTTPTATDGYPLRVYLNRLGCSQEQLTRSHGKICAGLDKFNSSSTAYPYTEIVTSANKFSVPSKELTFDLKIWYKDTKVGYPDFFCDDPVGDPTCSTNQLDSYLGKSIPANLIDPKEPNHLEILKKDQPISFTLEKDKTYILFWHPIYNDDNGIDRFLNDENIDGNPDISLDSYYIQGCFGPLTDLSKTNTLCGIHFSTDIGTFTNFTNTTYDAYTNKRYIHNQRYIKIDTTVINKVRFKPIRTDIVYSLISTDGGLIDSLTTHIQSTGYFGDAKRPIEAQIDRQTNQLIGIFDYVLYSQEAIEP